MTYIMIDEQHKRRENDLDDLRVERWLLGAAQVDDNPSDVTEKTERNLGVDERQQRLEYAKLEAVVAEVGTVT